MENPFSPPAIGKPKRGAWTTLEEELRWAFYASLIFSADYWVAAHLTTSRGREFTPSSGRYGNLTGPRRLLLPIARARGGFWPRPDNSVDFVYWSANAKIATRASVVLLSDPGEWARYPKLVYPQAQRTRCWPRANGSFVSINGTLYDVITTLTPNDPCDRAYHVLSDDVWHHGRYYVSESRSAARAWLRDQYEP